MPNTSPSKINPLLPRLPGWSVVPGRCQMTEITHSPGSRLQVIRRLTLTSTTFKLSASLALKGCCVLLTSADMMTRLLQTIQSGTKQNANKKIRKKVKIHFCAYFQFKSRDGRVCVECNLS